jgi:hypothetical protein
MIPMMGSGTPSSHRRRRGARPAQFFLDSIDGFIGFNSEISFDPFNYKTKKPAADDRPPVPSWFN